MTTRFGIVGSGWRSGFFVRAAEALPDLLAVSGVVTRTAERGAEVERAWGVPTYRTTAELLAGKPDFVVVSVPWAVAPVVTTELVERAVPVLCETPPAPDEDGLRELWSDVGASGLVQVAEQNPLMPLHQAQLALASSGRLGTITSAQVSSTHLYHAVALLRLLLGVGFAPASVTAREFRSPLVNPLTRDGWTDDETPQEAVTTIALLDFGDQRTGLYDFTDNQWHNPLRRDRIVLRGSHGELVDDRVVRLAESRTVVESQLVRRQAGVGLNLEGFSLDHLSLEGEVLYRNPFPGVRLSDDELAVATLLDRTAAWCRDEGEPPYSLAEACQDHLLGLAIGAAVQSGREVVTTRQPWQS